MLKERLSKNLRIIRAAHKWSQETAAELCDLSPRFWSKVELCKANASIETLEKISVGLQVSVEDLLKENMDLEAAMKPRSKGEK